jgi:hypothetical protein
VLDEALGPAHNAPAPQDLEHPGYARLEAALAALDVCPVHGVEHQPREHAVPCRECGRSTFDVHGLCGGHQHLVQFEVATT